LAIKQTRLLAAPMLLNASRGRGAAVFSAGPKRGSLLSLLALITLPFIILLALFLIHRKDNTIVHSLQTKFFNPQQEISTNQLRLQAACEDKVRKLCVVQGAHRQVIGSRNWSKLAEEEIVEGREGWEHANIVLKKWNNASLLIDEGHFLKERSEMGGGVPGFAWASWVSDPSDDKPVAFVTQDAPSLVLLPRCEINLSRYSPEGALDGGVAMCLIVRDEGRFLEEWFNYYYYLGARKILVYDHGSIDNTKSIAESFGPYVEYLDWSSAVNSTYDGDIQVRAYQDCFTRLADSGIAWVGYLDIDEFLVFSDNPAETLDIFLTRFPARQGEIGVGSIGFNWMVMTSNKVALPEPAFQSLDIPYTFLEGGGDGAHHVKVFVRVEATTAERITHAHFASLKPGWGQFDATGEKQYTCPWFSGFVQNAGAVRRRNLNFLCMKPGWGQSGESFTSISVLMKLTFLKYWCT
jgi:hypothetical protein